VAWPVYGGLGVYRAVAHELTRSERERLWRLARKSLGVPTRLSTKERGELRRIFTKLNPVTVARFIAAEASPLPWPKAPDSN
jgi:hypothetical protein